MVRRRKLCAVCETRPARKLKSRYTHAIEQAAFCSRRCAAEYGLLSAGQGDDGLNWCALHGWYTNAELMDDNCPHCPAPARSDQ